MAEPMIDLHQALHDTKTIEMLRCHLDVPLGKKSPMVMKAATIRVVKARGFFSAVRKKVVHMKVIHSSLLASAYCQRVSPDRWAGTTLPFGVIPFRNLKRSLSVERTRVVFSAMMDL